MPKQIGDFEIVFFKESCKYIEEEEEEDENDEYYDLVWVEVPVENIDLQWVQIIFVPAA
jgi:hypothetical protein